jgi:hypothetical protein
MISESLRQKLLKVQALARRGEGGEKQAAAKMLAKLMRKHGLTLDDIQGFKRTEHEFRYQKKFEKQMIAHIAAKVMNEWPEVYRIKGRSRRMYIVCTNAEAMDIQAEFDRLKPIWKEELDLLFSAFVHKHDLFAESDEGKGDNEIDPDYLRRLVNMMDGLQDAPSHYKALGLELGLD